MNEHRPHREDAPLGARRDPPLVTRVHKQLGAEGHRSVAGFGPDETMNSVRVPSVELCLSRLGPSPA